MTQPHHLKDKPKSLEQRAAIAASQVLTRRHKTTKEANPELWQAEYDIALFRLQRRAAMNLS